MKINRPLVIMIALAIAPYSALALQGQTPDEQAAFIAHASRPTDQFRVFILKVVNVTTTGRIIIKQLGPEKAEAFFVTEADKQVATFGAEWERNLAASWREALKPDELAAATRAAEARDEVAIAPFRARAGAIMQQKSAPLLQKATEGVLASCFKIMAPAL